MYIFITKIFLPYSYFDQISVFLGFMIFKTSRKNVYKKKKKKKKEKITKISFVNVS